MGLRSELLLDRRNVELLNRLQRDRALAGGVEREAVERRRAQAADFGEDVAPAATDEQRLAVERLPGVAQDPSGRRADGGGGLCRPSARSFLN